MTTDSRNRKTHKKTLRRGLSLYKTGGSPFWYARIWVSGERRYVVKSTRETSRLAAEEVAEEILHDLKQKRFVDGVPPRRSFQHFADRLLEEEDRLVARGEKHKLFATNDRHQLYRKGDGILAFLGRRDVGTIRTGDIRDYLNFLDDRRESPLSPGTKNRHIVVIRKVLKIAYERGAIDAIPPTPQVRKFDNPRPSFSEDEYKLLLKTAREVANEGVEVRGITVTMEIYYFIVFMTHTFLRPTESEVFSLRHKDISLKDKPWRLEISVKGKTGHRIATTTKHAPAFYKHLQDLYPDHQPSDFVFFPKYENRQTARRTVNRQFNYVLDRAGLKTTDDGTVRSAYALRHYALQTRILKSKGRVNIFTLAKVAGTSVDQLQRFYLKHLPIDERTAENLQTTGED